MQLAGGVPQGPKKLWGGWGGPGEALAGCRALETACSPPVSGPEVGGNFRHNYAFKFINPIALPCALGPIRSPA